LSCAEGVIVLEKPGTIMYWMLPPEPGGEVEGEGFKFRSPSNIDGIRVDVQKHPDGSFRVWVMGKKGVLTHFRTPMPEVAQSPYGTMGVHVAVTWEAGKVKLYLNSELAGTKVLETE